MNKAYERETEMWNQVFKECTPVDLRNLDLQVETMFDEALKLFAQKTTNVLDFGCGTGDISFQYLQYQPTHKVLGIDASKTGIEFANETDEDKYINETYKRIFEQLKLKNIENITTDNKETVIVFETQENYKIDTKNQDEIKDYIDNTKKYRK